ncbi:NAD(P)/FAD-dependent oxidoreductase [Clostridium sp. AM42-4]|uniref:NAD(P)/FAD-dependent oxidoreductase n=1 Tax=Clostridium sp. AM42-4 TaxID=2292305 RepID=UPI000E4D8691|nr:NAD(P)/FAD-dependent oxidoreductase [Clostridium sp. AM42-4]RHS82837.1 FAD/NAD(P)-binding oxidoreductase [Clostridium sp. AM42-4]HBM47493.1 FAD/NAD(P)-binding oxidoreductase [Lachnoclostridium sp.]
MNSMKYDVVVIGGGVIGCAVARELSRYQVKACVVEREEDVCSGTSKANSAIVHGGFDAEPGSLKAKFNILGSQMMEELSKELDFDYKRNGSLVLCFAEEDKPALEALYEKGVKNGVKGMSIISGDEVRKREPNIEDTVVAALDVPSGGIVCPFGLTIALAENACDNGVEFQFLTEVETIEKEAEGYVLKTSKGEIHTACVVNAAGVYSDQIHNFVSEKKLHITARKGDYCLLDKEAGSLVSHTIFQLPTKMGKGVLVSPTVHGNLLTGPTATDIENKEQTATVAEELDSLMSRASLSVKGIPFRQVITSFAGLRAHEDGDDFVIGEISDAPGFFDAAGIESPGLSSAPAIGQWLAEKVAEKLNAKKKEDWNGTRKGIVRPELLSKEERAELIRKNPAYGTIICRCESVSEGEIVDAITRTLGAKSLDGIKRRVRQGMGRCQAGFCTPRTMEILSRELGIRMEEVCKNAPGSEMLTGQK